MAINAESYTSMLQKNVYLACQYITISQTYYIVIKLSNDQKRSLLYIGLASLKHMVRVSRSLCSSLKFSMSLKMKNVSLVQNEQKYCGDHPVSYSR
jgi:hypothetical protein